MNKKFLLLTTLLYAYSLPCFAALEKSSASCESLGYTVDYDECIAKNTVPLLCPFATATNKKSLCVVDSCRGYPLKEEDFSQTASDGNSVIYHIKNSGGVFVPKQKDSHGVLGCLAAYEKGADGTLEEIWRYKIKECKSGSMFQNDLCDKGCNRVNKYPYDTHPGNVAGKVENCIDEESGEVFGYTECNEGWELKNGACLLNTCSIKEFPYLSNPNSIVDRGSVSSCQIGKNLYYRYTETSSDGASESCSNKGYTYINGVCIDNCNLTGCTPEDKTVSYTDAETPYTKTYHEWSCKQSTSYCRVGDYAVVNGEKIGVIAHMPDATYNKMLIVSSDVNINQKWGDGNASTTDTPLPNIGSVIDARQDYNGRLNTNTVLNFKQKNPTQLVFPAIEYAAKYSSPSCSHNICKAGEWYLPAEGEFEYLYDNRYILYKVTKYGYYTGGIIWSSTEVNSNSAWRLRSDVGIRDAVTKMENRYTIPVTSITLK